MTNNEIQATLKQIADTQLVHAKLILDKEREWKQSMNDLREVMKHHEDRLAANEDGLATMQAALTTLLKTMDDFIKGLNRENGHS